MEFQKTISPSASVLLNALKTSRQITIEMDGHFITHFRFDKCLNGTYSFEQLDEITPMYAFYYQGDDFLTLYPNVHSVLPCLLMVKSVSTSPQVTRVVAFDAATMRKMIRTIPKTS